MAARAGGWRFSRDGLTDARLRALFVPVIQYFCQAAKTL
jgi:hypothetical protein